ncbi:hypothetical protein LA080_008762 [Diaporthe eres]|nr:hypothetical protein LA080_008762 [Diaporthe eres]
MPRKQYALDSRFPPSFPPKPTDFQPIYQVQGLFHLQAALKQHPSDLAGQISEEDRDLLQLAAGFASWQTLYKRYNTIHNPYQEFRREINAAPTAANRETIVKRYFDLQGNIKFGPPAYSSQDPQATMSGTPQQGESSKAHEERGTVSDPQSSRELTVEPETLYSTYPALDPLDPAASIDTQDWKDTTIGWFELYENWNDYAELIYVS